MAQRRSFLKKPWLSHTTPGRTQILVVIIVLQCKMSTDQIQADYPLHWLVWNNDFEELQQALDLQQVR